jgi:hypothetical protein
MSNMMIFKNEPVAVQGLVQAAIGLAVAFGLVNWTLEQTGSVIALTAAVFAVVARRHVTPNHKVADRAADPAAADRVAG